MDLIINNKLIDAPIVTILKDLREETGNKYFQFIDENGIEDIKVTCPFHKDGQEHRPSCHVYAKSDNPKIYKGTTHCFTCGKRVPLYTVVGYCFGRDDEFGKQWLVDRYGNIILNELEYLPEIELNNNTNKVDYLDESILSKYRYFHPYMFKRKLTEDIIKTFSVGYDFETNSIVFPVWDENNHLVALTRRSVNGKQFQLESNKNKSVYLLNFIKNWNITTVYVVESQINALTLWTWGYPAIALLGTGSRYQYEILKKSGIRNYILCFDGDEAGDKGRDRFINAMNDDIFISYKVIPRGKDVNDLDKETFDSLEVI